MAYTTEGFRWGLDAVTITAHSGSTPPLYGEIPIYDIIYDDVLGVPLDFVQKAEVSVEAETDEWALSTEIFTVGLGVIGGKVTITLECEGGDIANIVHALGKTEVTEKTIGVGQQQEVWNTTTAGVIVPAWVSVLGVVSNPQVSGLTDYIYAPRCQAVSDLSSLVMSREERRTVTINLVAHASNQHEDTGPYHESGEAIDMTIDDSQDSSKPGSPIMFLSQKND